MSTLVPLLIFGTRPEAIKMAPLVHACERRTDLRPIVCVTGQHREMLASVMEYFGLRADLDLAVMTPDQTLSELTARCLQGVDGAIERFKPDCVVVQGDTTTAMAAALAAFYRRVPLVHVEAGLRTGDLMAPWPEELNRRIASLAAAVHCAPTQRAAQALAAEGVRSECIHVTGNTVIDALLWTAERERENTAQWEAKYSFFSHQPLVLVTAHRRENFGAGLAGLCDALVTLANRYPRTSFLYPLHMNPEVRRVVSAVLSHTANIHLVEPAPYPEFVWLMDRSTLILTDSGGIQEEAPSLGKPVLVMRDTTERPEALASGAVELVGTDAGRIVERASCLLDDPGERERRRVASSPFGDGKSAERIAKLMAEQAWLA